MSLRLCLVINTLTLRAPDEGDGGFTGVQVGKGDVVLNFFRML